MRFIDPAPRRLLEVEDLGSFETVAETAFETTTGGWAQIEPEVRVRPREGGWPLRFSEPVVTLQSSETLDAEQVQLILVDIAELRAGRVDLSWRGPGEDFGSDRRLRVETQGARGDSVKTFRFDVAANPRWTGAVAGLRLDVSFPGGSQCVLKRVTAGRIVGSSERLAEAAGKAWRVDLQHEVRPARLARQGAPLRWEVAVGKGARLHVAYGLMPGYRGKVEFHIDADAPELGLETVFSKVVDEGDEQRYSWRDVVVELDRYAGRRVSLTFAADGGGSESVTPSLPVWANPIVTTPRRGRSPASIILVSADTLRADRLSLYGNPRRTSPAIDRWATDEGVVFGSTVVQSPWTLPSHVSMLTGLDAPHHGVNHDLRVVPEDLELMAELLRDAGWITCAVTGGGFLHPRYAFDQGFDRYFYWPKKGSAGELDAVVHRASDWMGELRDVPLFLFVHSYQVHGPYRVHQPFYDAFVAEGAPPAEPSALVALEVDNPLREEGFRARDQRLVWQSGRKRGQTLRPEELPIAVAMYDSGVAKLDAGFGRILERAAEMGMADRCVVVFTSDHGEALGEHNRGGHGYLYESNLLVPLVMSFPDRRAAGQVIQEQVRSIDILPTVLDVLGVPAPERIDGVTLLPLIAGDRASAPPAAWTYASSFNLGISLRVANRTKYTFNNTAWSELYDQRSVFHLGTDTDDLHGLPPNEADRRLIDDRVHSQFLGASRGLVVRVANAESSTLAGSVSGSAVSANDVKSWAMSASRVDWIRRGHLAFHVLPGGSLTLVLERWNGEILRLQGAVEGSDHRLDERVDAEAAAGALSIRLGSSGWTRTTSYGPFEGTGVVLLVIGSVEMTGQSPVEADEALREQLRALGYIQ